MIYGKDYFLEQPYELVKSDRRCVMEEGIYEGEKPSISTHGVVGALWLV